MTSKDLTSCSYTILIQAKLDQPMHTSLDLSQERPDAVVVGVDADGGLERLLGEAVEAEHVVDPPEAVQARDVRRVHAQAVLVARLRHLQLVARLVYLTPAAESMIES